MSPVVIIYMHICMCLKGTEYKIMPQLGTRCIHDFGINKYQIESGLSTTIFHFKILCLE